MTNRITPYNGTALFRAAVANATNEIDCLRYGWFNRDSTGRQVLSNTGSKIFKAVLLKCRVAQIMRLFRIIYDFSRCVLFLDLDSLFVGNLHTFFDYGGFSIFCALSNCPRH